ncbi:MULTISPECIES: hypothetical protein [Roseivirga]|jgi:hypothetical protein|uniref:Uncharacterized protein n=1 Tax=Roseivirga spongicola TaxID=333140 RepID=A0A150XF19_9BACT|nr:MULTISPECIES: hypothetical protein [Roseivirga]KYG77264.1 hypothetical protein AWW68_00400 [Roseivirga spongicola]MBO6662649.1 hypothetical protein [Roseivirga sp.]MBO6762866.1 hypothetical protein [Roseivirga sp.]MBO6909656.1 hypothetical protein [Roseivirga sp.]WPZ10963.1 hypothetical protein T7867_02480 [Roseivirga spongicola]
MVFSIKDGKLQIGGHDVKSVEESGVKYHKVSRDEALITELKRDHEIPEDHLNALLDIPEESRNTAWEFSFLKTLPKVKFNPNRIFGCNNNHYQVLELLPKNDQSISEVEFIKIINHAFENELGLAILRPDDNNNKPPEATVRFGAVWAYKEFSELGGAPNTIQEYLDALSVKPESPFEAEKSNSDKISIGEPNPKFFPEYVKSLVVKFIKEFVPEAQPNFGLLSQERFIAPYSILVDLNTECPDDIMNKLRYELTWFMPPYLPITLR